MNRPKRLVLPLCLLFIAIFAHASVHGGQTRITVLDSETHSRILDSSGIPKNCDGVSFDAYCFNSKTTDVTNTLLAQERNQPPFRISCSVDSKWSRCTPLSKGEGFDARKEKRGIVVYFLDEESKQRKQFYAFVDGAPDPCPADTAAATGSRANHENADAPSTAIAVPMPNRSNAPPENMTCRFSSAPAGADISLDGQYVGNTPSALTLTVGKGKEAKLSYNGNLLVENRHGS